MKILKPGDRVKHPTLETSGTVVEASDSHALVQWDAGFRSGHESDILGPGSASPTAAGWYWFMADPEHEATPSGLRLGINVVEERIWDWGAKLVAFPVASYSSFPVETLKGCWQRIDPPEWMH